MKTQNIIKTIAAIFIICLISMGATAQQNTGEKLDCQYVEWNIKKDVPDFEKASSEDCIVIQLVGFSMDQCKQLETLSGSLSSNHVSMRMSEDLRELNISMNINPVNSQRRLETYSECIISLKQHLK